MRLFLSFLIFLIITATTCLNRVSQVESDSRPVSHDQWTKLLKKYVKEGLVDYKGFLQDTVDLQSYLDLLGSHHPNNKYWSPEERLAYWINAYNAFTIELVLAHYPVESIKDIGKGSITFVNTVWDEKFIEIEGQEYDLNNIEHGIIRDRFEDPRIHFALNCASMSCPDLLDEAYSAGNLDGQLEKQTKRFLYDTSKNRFYPEEGRAELSKIFDWFKDDFTEKGTLVDYLNKFLGEDLPPETKVEYMEYDWRLNES